MGGQPLPAGAVASSSGTSKPIQLTTDEKSLFDKIINIPMAIKKAATGEDKPIQFPDVPESTNLAEVPEFLDGLTTNFKIMFARDALSKAEIIDNEFKGNERYGGVYVDEFENPMIVWDGQPYYVNKPGFSQQDIGTFVGELVKYTPASKIVSGAKSLLGTIARGAGAYSVTELSGEAIESILAPITAKNKKRDTSDIAQDVGIATGISVAADVAIPPMLRGAGIVLKEGAKQTKKAVDLPFVKGTADKIIKTIGGDKKQVSKFPLTQGQRTAGLPDSKKGSIQSQVTSQLEEEDLLRQSPSTAETAKFVIKGFDENQLSLIRKDAEELIDEFGSGDPSIARAEFPTVAVAEKMQTDLSKTASDIKTKASTAYGEVTKFGDEVLLNQDSFLKLGDDVQNILNDLGVQGRLMTQMPILAGEVKYLKKIIDNIGKGKFELKNLKELHGYQKSLNLASRNAPVGSPEALAISQIKGKVDDLVFDGIENGFLIGDAEILDQLKSATELYRTYMGLTGKATAKDSQQKAANKILEKLTNPNFTPVQLSNALFGHAKFNPAQSMNIVLSKLKNSIPDEQYNETLALLKDAVLQKAFSGRGNSGITRTNIVNNFDEIFIKNKNIINNIFSKDEILKIKKFRENVMPTLWADIKLNPSGTSYTILGALARRGLFYTSPLPMGFGDIGKAVDEMSQITSAKNAIRQWLLRKNQPLLSNITSATTRPSAIQEEPLPPEIKNILEGLSDVAKQKILQSSP